MAEPSFFQAARAFSLDEIAALTGARIVNNVDGSRQITRVAPLDVAGPTDLTFIENPKYLPDVGSTKAAGCFCAPKYTRYIPADVAALEIAKPYDAYVQLQMALYPDALKPPVVYGPGIAATAQVHPEARLEADVTVEHGAVIGAGAEIGSGTIIGPGAAIGRQVRIGRNCYIGAGCTVEYGLIGNRVILYPGVRIGQDGFSYIMGGKGHRRVPQVGRVVIQDDVEIGANTTIDRGANRDTIIGEGTKIDNLVQVGHNVVIGRHCVIAAQSGISGSTTLEDFVVLGGQVGIAGHVTIGAGSQIAAKAGIFSDVEPGSRYGGYPAKPIRQWHREGLTVAKLSARETANLRIKGEGEGE